MASGSDDKTIKIWDINSLECIKTLTGFNVPNDWYVPGHNLILEMPNKMIAFPSNKGSIQIWGL
jgi:WD40 repeat protein